MFVNGPGKIRFKGETTTVDLLYYAFNFLYIGLNYTYFRIPVESHVGTVYTMYEDPSYYTYAAMQTYGMIAGVDSFSIFLREGVLDSKTNKGWGGLEIGNSMLFSMWVEGWLGIGFGSEHNEMKNKNFFAFHYFGDYTLGLLFGGGNKGRFVAGIGYNLNSNLYMLHHGVVARAAIKF